MFGRDKGPKLVGAREKIRKAQMIKRGGRPDEIDSKGEGKKSYSTTIVLIFLLSCALAFMLMQGPMKLSGLDYHTGWSNFDRVIFSAGTPSVTGTDDYDMIAVPVLRGLVIFALAGIMPLLSLLWVRAIDRPNTNPYIAVWGTSVGSFLTFYVVRDFLWPLMQQVFETVSG